MPFARRLKFLRRLSVCLLENRTVPAAFTVTNNSDSVVTGPGQLPGSLRQAIFDANADANPDADFITIGAIASPINLSAGAYKITAKNLTITGPGSVALTINGGNASRVFEIRDNPFEGIHIQCDISGLTITAGKVTGSESGGGIFISDEFVTLTDVAVTNCTSTNGGGGIFAQGFDAKLTLNSCTISGNTTSDPSLSLHPSGGGLYFYGANLSVSNSTITNNTSSDGLSTDTAEASGGGASFTGDSINATVSFTNCNITNNTAGIGGGLYSTNFFGGGIGMAVSLVNCAITGNKAMGNADGTHGGGGAYFDFIGKLTVSQCTITGNQVSGKADGSDGAQGGGLRITRLDNALDPTLGKFGVTVLNSTITNNISSGGAGGLWLDQSPSTKNAPILMSGCIIDSNQANGKTIGILGGGLSFSNYGINATVLDCQITNNFAYTGGGGIQIQGDSETVTLNNIPSSLTVRNSTIAYNSTGDTASGRGAGIGCFNFGLNNNNKLTVQNSTIAFNQSAFVSGSPNVSAGGIYTSAGTGSVGPAVKIESSILYANTNNGGSTKADFYGAVKGIDVLNSLISVTDSPAAIVYTTDSANIKGTAALPANPMIDSVLASNGATTTKTLALNSASPCINTGSNPAPALANDQRGVGFLRTVAGATDMGAFEFQSPPQVTAIIINDGSVQRSLVKSIKVSFSETVSFPSGIATAFDVSRIDKGTLGSVAPDFSQSGADVTITFKAGGTVGVDPGNSLEDGKYMFTIFADKVQGTGGFLDGNMNGNYDGAPADNKTLALHRLFGDATGDGAVTSNDFAMFRTFFGLGASIFDFNDDGNTSSDDFAAFRLRFGLSGYL